VQAPRPSAFCRQPLKHASSTERVSLTPCLCTCRSATWLTSKKSTTCTKASSRRTCPPHARVYRAHCRSAASCRLHCGCNVARTALPAQGSVQCEMLYTYKACHIGHRCASDRTARPTVLAWRCWRRGRYPSARTPCSLPLAPCRSKWPWRQ